MPAEQTSVAARRAAPEAERIPWPRAVVRDAGVYYLSLLVVLAGLVFSETFIPLASRRAEGHDLLGRMLRYDSLHYRHIASNGYSYDPTRQSEVAFFPAYPLLVRGVAEATGLSVDESLVAVANVALLGCYVLLGVYARGRAGDPAVEQWTVAAFALWPTTMFMRMGYSESLFCAELLVVLLGFQRGWAGWVVALAAGLAAGTRPVGVAAAVAVGWWALTGPGRWPARTARAVALSVLSCWGLAAYMAYLGTAFGNPFAFADTQQHWTNGAPADRSVGNKVASLLTLEPVRGVYDPESDRYWGRLDQHGNAVCSLLFWNPIFFGVAAVGLATGAVGRRLTGPEVVLGAALLLIPYATRAFEMSMSSHARFASVVIPFYLVVGWVLSRMPQALAGCACGLMGVALGSCSALFGAGYRFY